MVVVAGADARFGRNHGLAIDMVRTEDGTEYAASDYFTSLGGHLTTHPCQPGEFGGDCPCLPCARTYSGR